MIHEGEYNKEEVLHDTCQLLGIGKKKNNEELHERCYKHLIEVGYVKLIDK